jgi:hypothetical protein
VSIPPLFTFAPNWQFPVQEVRGYTSSLVEAYGGDEYRGEVRPHARSVVQYQATLTEPRDRQKFDAFLHRYGASRITCPLWMDGRGILASASNIVTIRSLGAREFVEGGYAAIIAANGDHRIYAISNIVPGAEADAIQLDTVDTLSFGLGDLIYPAYDAELSPETAASRITAEVENYNISVELFGRPEYETASALIYRNHPLIDTQPNRIADIGTQYLRQLAQIESVSGLRFRKDRTGRTLVARANTYTCFARSQIDFARAFLDYLRGRYRGVWCSNWQSDLTLAAPISAADDTIDIARIDYTDSYDGAVGRSDIAIKLRSGGTIYRRIVDAVALDATTERLELSSPVGVDLSVSDVRMISWLDYVRLSTDDITITWFTAETAEITLPLRSVAEDIMIDFLTQQDVDWRRAVKACTTGNINIASGLATYDGVSFSAGDYLLVANQTDKKQNGIYEHHGTGEPLTRRFDANADDLMQSGIAGRVMRGTTYGGALFFLDNLGAVDIGTTDIDFAIYRIELGNGLEYSANTTRIKRATNSGLTLSPSGLAVGKGDGIGGTGTTIDVDLDTNSGMELVGGKLRSRVGEGITRATGFIEVDLAANPALEFSESQLRLKTGETIERTASGAEVKRAADSGLEQVSAGLRTKATNGLERKSADAGIGAKNWVLHQSGAGPGASMSLPSTPVVSSMVLWRIAGEGATPNPMVNRTTLDGGRSAPYNTTDYYTVSGATVSFGANITGEAMVIAMYLPA